MHRAVHSNHAPKAIGPYSQAVVSGDFILTSGSIGLDPLTQQMVKGSFEEEVKQVMANLRAVLNEAGVGFNDVVKTTVYLTDLAQFQAFNDIYGSYFTAPYPARSTVQVSALPKGARVEIDAVARKDHIKQKKTD